MKLLIAEDDAVSRWVLQEILETWGYDVTACENGEQAWETYREGDFRVAISDMTMPEMTGLDLCRKIRAEKRDDYCYFILLTTQTDKDCFWQGMDAGADDYMIKPFDADQLKARLMVAERILALGSDERQPREPLPFCCQCNKIQKSDWRWLTIDEYIAERTGDTFVRSVCPECSQKSDASHRSVGVS